VNGCRHGATRLAIFCPTLSDCLSACLSRPKPMSPAPLLLAHASCSSLLSKNKPSLHKESQANSRVLVNT